MDALAETLPTGASPFEVPPGALVGRYDLGEVLGRGGSGVVYAATDRLTGDAVAVKLGPVMGEAAGRQLRRELSALLALRLPGVVRLRDEGTVGDTAFLVTDRVDGVPFTASPPSWAAWRPRVIGLFDVLARIHLAGVVHRDLKPANVLVDPQDRVVLLDFGLAQGRLVERSIGGLVEGTPRYMAPEQRAGLPSDERTDLFAAGGMVLELVTGEALTRPPRFEGLRRAAIPSALVAAVEAMLSDDPADRPRSALEVLAALDADPREGIGAGMPPGPWSEVALEQLFVDRARSFLHLAEDAAALLHAETGGDERQTRLVVDRWIRAGLATWAGDGRIAIARAAIEQIAAGHPGSPQGALVAMLEAGEGPETVSAAARRIGRGLADEGHIERALSVLDAAEWWARGTPAERGLLEDRIAWSLVLGTTAAAERTLYRVGRADLDPATRAAWSALLRGGRAAYGGDPTRALELLGSKPGGLGDALEASWHALRWKAASQVDLATHAAEVAASASWAERAPDRKSLWTGWLGYLRYLERRYAESATLLLEAAGTRRVPRERAQMVYMAASSLVECGEGDRAREAALEAVATFRAGRAPELEATATWLLRMIDLRFGPGGPPDPELVAAAADVPSIAGHLLLTEAALAFRQGDLATCAALAARAREAVDGGSPLALLADGLRGAVEPGAVDADAVRQRALGSTPQLALQVLGFLARGSLEVAGRIGAGRVPCDPHPTGGRPDSRAELAAAARSLLPALAGVDRQRRLEVVSIAEALGWLGITDDSAAEDECRTT